MENNINIDGIGSIREGQYQNVSIDGIGTIQGNIDVEKIEVNGKAKALGKIDSNYMEVNGVFNVCDYIKVKKECKINGYCKTDSSITGKYLDVNGRLSVKDEVDFDNIQVSGEIFISGNCKCENLFLDGKAKIDGLLSGDNLDLNILKVNEIKEIGGEKISVKKRTGTYKVLFFTKEINTKLICEEIEADEIYLENTNCNIVRGRNIEIGDNCVINKIEYTGELKESGKSKIKEKVQL